MNDKELGYAIKNKDGLYLYLTGTGAYYWVKNWVHARLMTKEQALTLLPYVQKDEEEVQKVLDK